MATQPIREVKGWNTRFVRSAPAWAPLLSDTTGDDFDYGDVRIGHIDSGYVEHAVFGSWSENGTNEHILVDRGANFVDNERDARPTDPVDGGLSPGHGTRIGSVMYGFAPGHMVGVAPRVPVVPYRAITSVALLTSDALASVTRAIEHAVSDSYCSVINLSLGARPAATSILPFGRALTKLGRACDQAYEEGVIVVAALGNNLHDRATYPAKYWRTICAGGLEPVFLDGQFKGTEEWKPQPNPLAEDDQQFIDVWAPADKIFRANVSLRDGTVQDQYASLADGDGTSYAAAAVSGAAAIWLARRRADIETLYEEPWMLTEAFRKLLHSSHGDLPDGEQKDQPTPVLNVEALVDADLPKPSTLAREERECSAMWG